MMTVEEIYDDITAAQAAEGALADVDVSGDTATSLQQDISNGSRVARHRIIKWVVAYVMWAQRFLFELFKVETRELARDGHYGTPRWWVATMLAFQYGYDLTFTPKDSYYEVIDPSAQRIKLCAVVELGHKVVLKVAKPSGSGFTNLSQPELIAAQDYANEKGPPMIIEVRTARADDVRIYGTVVCDAKQGVPGIKSNVEAAIDAYLITLAPQGAIRLTDIRNAVFSVNGVVDFVLTQCDTKPWGSPLWRNLERARITFAGHCRIANAWPLDETLNYVSANV